MSIHRLFVVPLLCSLIAIGSIAQFHAQAQTFSVTPKQLSASGKPGDYLDTWADVENMTSAASSMRVQVMSQQMPDGWSASFCLVNCYAPDAVDITDTFDPNQKVSFHITWSTSATQAEGSLTYKLTNTANPSETYTLTFTASTIQVSVPEREYIKSSMLYQNYPNPFSISKSNEGVGFSYMNAKSGSVTLKVYDLLGHEVATLVNDVQSAGRHNTVWNGLDGRRRLVAPGIYIYKLTTSGATLTRRMLVTR
jgi:hypothetical protein